LVNKDRLRWTLGVGIPAALLMVVVWLVVTDAPIVRMVIRLYRDNAFLREAVASWGWAAPIVFVVIQALQVLISPIPGEITGPVGGALFGTLWGVIYSTIGLSIGTMLCFLLGRIYGEPIVRPFLSEHHWTRMNFILETEGAILCFIIYLMPGFPKDIVSYLFGISPIPFWVFAIVSTVGRVPGTWVSSYVGAHVAEQEFVYPLVLLALVVAVTVPIYYYRHRILGWFRGGDHKTIDKGGTDP
jgi:uncharacterized membrane protein YdjX (TVP38/TMEM64 family)